MLDSLRNFKITVSTVSIPAEQMFSSIALLNVPTRSETSDGGSDKRRQNQFISVVYDER